MTDTRLSDADLVTLEKRYTASEVPPCHVCAGPLTVASMGGGCSTIWACSGMVDDPNHPGELIREPGRKIADDHYRISRWTEHRSGDSDVLAVIAEVRAFRATTGATPELMTRLREGYQDAVEGAAYDPGASAGGWVADAAKALGLEN